MINIKLTQYAKGAGCGCKIAPAVLEQILASQRTNGITQPNLLMGNQTNDDAAVYDLQNGQYLLVTTDFFMPIVDDAFTFGQIAAANALSDVYAMGGTPITAIAILGWPIDKLSAEVAAEVMKGATASCAKAGVVISGGHTIDAPEPFFGLSVNGLVAANQLKRNSTAKLGDVLLLSKPIGVGILATAQKRGVLQAEHEQEMLGVLTDLNRVGGVLAKLDGVNAMTDITGFGLLGHLNELCEGSNLSAQLSYDAIPKLPAALHYIKQHIIPDATYRNWNAYSNVVEFAPGVDATEAFMLLPDPQTNGGLLLSVSSDSLKKVIEVAKEQGTTLVEIGVLQEAKDKRIWVNP